MTESLWSDKNPEVFPEIKILFLSLARQQLKREGYWNSLRVLDSTKLTRISSLDSKPELEQIKTGFSPQNKIYILELLSNKIQLRELRYFGRVDWIVDDSKILKMPIFVKTRQIWLDQNYDRANEISSYEIDLTHYHNLEEID
jgi:hypothetical protein